MDFLFPNSYEYMSPKKAKENNERRKAPLKVKCTILGSQKEFTHIVITYY